MGGSRYGTFAPSGGLRVALSVVEGPGPGQARCTALELSSTPRPATYEALRGRQGPSGLGPVMFSREVWAALRAGTLDAGGALLHEDRLHDLGWWFNGRFLKHRTRLHYDRALAAGLPTATEVIEGACRHLVKDRMDRTGARWSLQGAEAVLRLCSLRSSGDFEAYSAFHLQQEHDRTHRARHGGDVPWTPMVDAYGCRGGPSCRPHRCCQLPIHLPNTVSGEKAHALEQTSSLG